MTGGGPPSEIRDYRLCMSWHTHQLKWDTCVIEITAIEDETECSSTSVPVENQSDEKNEIMEADIKHDSIMI